MGVFRQLGDPLAAAPVVCLCQHHGVAYAERGGLAHPSSQNMKSDSFADGATILQTQITITETCCVVVNAATNTGTLTIPAHIEIERPLGTPRTMQRDIVVSDAVNLHHHAAWEVLPPGIYDYFLVNHRGVTIYVFAAWLKIVASDCEG